MNKLELRQVIDHGVGASLLSYRTLIAVAFTILSFLLFFNFLYLNKVWPNTYFGNINVGGVKNREVKGIVDGEVERFKKEKIVFKLSDESEISTNADELGVNFDVLASANKINGLGRSGDIKEDLAARVKAPFKKSHVEVVYTVDFDKFLQTLETKVGKLDKKAQEAKIVLSGGRYVAFNEIQGELVDRVLLTARIRDEVENLQTEQIQLNRYVEEPKIKSSEATEALVRANSLINATVDLVFGNELWRISNVEFLELLKFEPRGATDELKADILGNLITVGAAKGAVKPVDVAVDEIKLTTILEDIEADLNRNTVDATLKFENGRVLEFTPAQDGQELDREKTKELFLANVASSDEATNNKIVIHLPVNVTKAKIANDEDNSLGIKELIGRGESYFAGSIPNRVFNVGLGASRVSGVLVAPGEVFSFNKTVGEISSATGYREAYVISSGRTVLDDGGGICQVSTTVFRAAINSGMPIVARTAHAYRVGYYEQRGFGPGIDATIWHPSVDLQFKNDTDQHILIQAVVNRASAKLTVDFYGTNDGRRVEVSKPVITNQKPALPDKYQDDPTLAKGTIEQVDFAAPGASVYFSRKVYKNGDLILDDKFSSNFRPWQAVFLVGTME